MEMEDHTQHTQYGGIDLRQFISGRPTHFPSIPPPPPHTELFAAASHRNPQLPPPPPTHYDMLMMIPRGGGGGGGGGLHEFRSDHSTSTSGADNSGSTTVAAGAAAPPPLLGGLDGEVGGFGGDGGTGRWPRQETLTLLEIRSRLDSKFKEANQKGPLWDEVSRIMSEEHGYQRSGKKCREKFENLYKYYKKTKEGKAGRQDGKHYRFFRQLEALYGESSNNNNNQALVPDSSHYASGSTLRFHHTSAGQANQESTNYVHHSHQKLCDSLSLSNNSSEFDTSSSEDNDLSTATLGENNDSNEKRRRRKGGWKAKIKDFIDVQMKKLIERQEAWLDKLTKTLEQKEQERVFREEEWRKQEAARIDREHKFWAKERAWIEARDTALMDALKKLTGRELTTSPPPPPPDHIIQNQIENQNEQDDGSETINNSRDSWTEAEITRLMQLRNSMESKFQQSGCMEDHQVLWEEIAAKMAYERSGSMCKEKWDWIQNSLRKNKNNNEAGSKKRKENNNSRSCSYNFHCITDQHQSMYNNPAAGGTYCEIKEPSSPANSNAATATVNDSCFRFFMGDHGENLWENYGLKLNNGDPNQ